MSAAARTLFDFDKYYFSTIEVQKRFLRAVCEGNGERRDEGGARREAHPHLTSELKNPDGDLVATAH
jgi:hypothetical protein